MPNKIERERRNILSGTVAPAHAKLSLKNKLLIACRDGRLNYVRGEEGIKSRDPGKQNTRLTQIDLNAHINSEHDQSGRDNHVKKNVEIQWPDLRLKNRFPDRRVYDDVEEREKKNIRNGSNGVGTFSPTKSRTEWCPREWSNASARNLTANTTGVDVRSARFGPARLDVGDSVKPRE